MLFSNSIVSILARRFFLSRSSDSFISFIAWISIMGVALGVLALTVVTSVINGFENELSRVVTGMYGDVVLYSRGTPVDHADDIQKRIQEVVPEVVEVTRSFNTQLMVSGPSGVAGAALEGLELETVAKVTEIPKRIREGRLPQEAGEVVLGMALAAKIGAQVGSEVRLIVPFGDGDFNGKPSEDIAQQSKVASARVVGLLKMGLHDYDKKVLLMTLPATQNFLNQPGRITTFKMKMTQGADLEQISARLTKSFGFPFRARYWAEFNKNLFYAIKLEKAVIAIVLSAIILVASFNTLSTLMMMIHDKTREISILKTMGLKRGHGFLLFCTIGMSIGLLGTLLGIGLGIGLNSLLDKSDLIHLSEEVYNIGKFPIIVYWNEIIMIGAASLVISFIATLYPALKIAYRSPLDGIRYE